MVIAKTSNGKESIGLQIYFVPFSGNGPPRRHGCLGKWNK
jgi:hypothetical protein